MKNFKKKSILFISLALVTATIAFANAYDEPGKPGKPKTTDWGKDFCDLEWTKPRTDGGSPIISYRAEKKSGWFFPSWDKCYGVVPGNETRCTVVDLTEGEEYEFRVFATNRAGDSDPSDASAPVITKER